MGWSSSKCVACEIGEDKKMPENGHNCFSKLTELSSCNDGWTVEKEEKVTCVACAENCKCCKELGAGMCDLCMPGWTRDEKGTMCMACSKGCAYCTSGCA